MIANSAFLAAMLLLLLVFWLLGAVEFLVPYKRHLMDQYAWFLIGGVAVVFINLFALVYATTRFLFLKDTGRKLAHVDRQLGTGDTVVRDLSEQLAREE